MYGDATVGIVVGDVLGPCAEIVIEQTVDPDFKATTSDNIRAVGKLAGELLEDSNGTRRRVEEKPQLNSCSLLPSFEFEKVDALADKATPVLYKTIPSLVEYISSAKLTSESDLNTARAIYRWVCRNIHQDPDGFFGDEPLYSFEADDVWRDRVTVGQGFAKLFQALATALGLLCKYVEGRAKIWSYEENKEVSCSHAWNMVRVEKCWGLVDACWGSGDISESGRFIRSFNPNWFLTPPDIFAARHFPHEPAMQLLVNPMDKVAYVCGNVREEPAFKLSQAFRLSLEPLTHPDMCIFTEADGQQTLLFGADSSVLFGATYSGGSAFCDMDPDGHFRVRIAATAQEGRLCVCAAPKKSQRLEECFSYYVRSPAEGIVSLPRAGPLWRPDLGYMLLEPLSGQLLPESTVRFVVFLGAESSNPVIVAAGKETPMHRDDGGRWVAEIQIPQHGDVSLRRVPRPASRKTRKTVCKTVTGTVKNVSKNVSKNVKESSLMSSSLGFLNRNSLLPGSRSPQQAWGASTWAAGSKPGSRGSDKPGSRGSVQPGSRGADKPGSRGTDKAGNRGSDKIGPRCTARPTSQGFAGAGFDRPSSQGTIKAKSPRLAGFDRPSSQGTIKHTSPDSFGFDRPGSEGADRNASRGLERPVSRGTLQPPRQAFGDLGGFDRPASRGADRPASRGADRPASRGTLQPPSEDFVGSADSCASHGSDRPASRDPPQQPSNPDVYLWYQISGGDRPVSRVQRRPRTRAVAKDVVAAAKEGNWDTVFAALEMCPHLVNVNPEMINPSMRGGKGSGMTILHYAARWGDLAVLRRLILDFHADPAAPGPDGKKPEDIALEHGHEMFAEYLHETQEGFNEAMNKSLHSAAAINAAESFRKWDSDGNGTISKEELGNVLQALNPKFVQSSLDVLFKMVDKDDSGDIDFEEFISFLNL